MSDHRMGLVLTAGGARGAYQAGVLERISKLPSIKNNKSPFSIICGTSAGSINAVGLAAGANNFREIASYLSYMWGSLSNEQIYRTDMFSLLDLSSKILKDLSLGSVLGGGQAQSFLDASPLRVLLLKHVPFYQIQRRIDAGDLYAVAVSATDYESGKAFTFIQGVSDHIVWSKKRQLAIATPIQIEHICASSAIPLVFAPVQIKTPFGEHFFGDGALRQTSPCSPAVRLGAQKILAIGVRQQQEEFSHLSHQKPSLAKVLGVVLNAMFLDSLENDLEHLNRMNRIAVRYGAAKESGAIVKKIDALGLFPSLDIRRLAMQHTSTVPKILRYILEGLGSSDIESSDLMSYLIFSSEYTKELVALGYRDTDQRIDEIEAFLMSDV